MTQEKLPHRKELCLQSEPEASLEALSVEYAMGELEKNKGTQFDPKAADAFIELIKEGKVPL